MPTFPDGKLRVKVGLSQISIDQGRKNLEEEIPGWSLAEVERQSRKKWNEALGGIQVEVSEAAQKQAFYQAFRNCLVTPTDKSNEHRKDPSAPYYDDWLAGWDTFPCKESLLMLAEPRRYGKIMDGMLTASRYLDGFLFDVLVMDAPVPTRDTGSSEIWLAEAIQKDIPFDQKAGFATLLHNATASPPAYIQRGVGRNGGSYDWTRGIVGKCEHGTDGCGEYGLDMTLADYAIALAARKLGDEATYRKFKEESLTCASIGTRRRDGCAPMDSSMNTIPTGACSTCGTTSAVWCRSSAARMS